MATEHAEPVPDAGNPQRYPTPREIVDVVLAQGATLGAKPTRTCPNYAVPCEDLDSNPQQLVVAALGRQLALVGPGGLTVVLSPPAVGEVFLTEQAKVSVTRPYTKTVELTFEFLSARLTYWSTLDQIRTLNQMLTDAETTMLGWAHNAPPTNQD